MNDLERLESAMLSQRLSMYPRTLDSEQLALPGLVEIFLKERRRALSGLPTQERYLKAVIDAAPDLPEMSVRARASRTYPALVRQSHFQTALKTYGHFEGVHWIIGLDMAGVDLMVLDRGFMLGVALSVSTDMAASWQHVKRQRHPPLSGMRLVHLDVDPNQAPRIGPFWVHPLSDVWIVENAMEALQHQAEVATV